MKRKLIISHLVRDTASISGVNPFFTLTPEQFNNLASLMQPLGISKPFLADALTINPPELLGGVIALLSTVLLEKKANPTMISKLSGAYAISSLISANPMLAAIAASGLTYSLVKSENKKEVLITTGRGAIVSGGSLLIGGLVGGPVWIGCIVAVTAAIAPICNPSR